MNEKISALLDAELERHEWDNVLASLGKDKELRETWDRYHLVGAAIRSELQLVVDPGLADRIASRIEGEKTMRAVGIPTTFSRTARYGAGFALAASIAAVSVYGIRFVWPTAPQSTQLAATRSVSPVPPVAKADQTQSGWDKSLNQLLVQHSAYAPASGMGVMPYVRIAGPEDNN